MPSWELFEAQPRDYRDTVLPPEVKRRLAIEAGIAMGWERYTGAGGAFVGMTSFGASAPGGVVMEKFGFTAENVAVRVLALLGRE
jgi:transketolase